MNPEKFLIAVVIFNAIMTFLPVVGVNSLVPSSSVDVYHDANGNEIVNATSGVIKIDIGAYAWQIISGTLTVGIVAALFLKFSGIALSAGIIIAYSIFFGFFITTGLKTISVIVSVINTVSSGFPIARLIMMGIFAIFMIVFIYSIFVFLRQVASGGVYE